MLTNKWNENDIKQTDVPWGEVLKVMKILFNEEAFV